MEGFTRVARADEVAPGTAKLVILQDKEIALYNVGGTFYATTNTCPHQGGPLAEGTLQGNIITCPWHMWTYDVTNGDCKINPRARIACFEVKVDGPDVFLKA